MVHKIRMPKIDANVEEATVGAWLKETDEWVDAGEKLVEVITDKANFELESDESGYLREKVAAEKSVVPVGYVVALMSKSPDEPLPDVHEENQQIMDRHREQMLFGGPAAEPEVESDGDTEPAGRSSVRATPAARRLARQQGVSLDELPGSGEGVIREEDVEAYIDRSNE